MPSSFAVEPQKRAWQPALLTPTLRDEEGAERREGDFLDVSIFAFFLRSEEGQKAGSLAVVLLRRLASAKFDATSCVRGVPKREHPRAKFCSLHRQ